LSGEIEDYLKTFNEADRLWAKILLIADTLNGIAIALRKEIKTAHAAIPSAWPTRDQLAETITSFNKVTELVHRLYQAIPAEMRSRIDAPDRIGISRIPVTKD